MPKPLTIADDLAQELLPYEAQIAEILELGIREWQAREETGYNGGSSILEKFAALPTPVCPLPTSVNGIATSTSST